MDLKLFETDTECEDYFKHDNYDLVKREIKIMQYIQNIFHVENKYKCMVLPSFFYFILIKIGFTNHKIICINNLISDVKHLSYYDLKVLNFSSDEIQSVFYLIDKKNSFFKNYIFNKYIFNKEDLVKECAICCDNFSVKEEIIKLNCNHMFHVKCILQWNKTCPYCRQPFQIESEIPVLIAKWVSQEKYAFAYLKLIECLLRSKKIPLLK